jgi:hypothetical protein
MPGSVGELQPTIKAIAKAGPRQVILTGLDMLASS